MHSFSSDDKAIVLQTMQCKQHHSNLTEPFIDWVADGFDDSAATVAAVVAIAVVVRG